MGLNKMTRKPCKTPFSRCRNERPCQRSKSTGDIKKLYEQNLIYDALMTKKRPLTSALHLKKLATPKKYTESVCKEDIAKDKLRFKGCTPRIKQLSSPKMVQLLHTYDAFRYTLPIRNAEILANNLTGPAPMDLGDANTFFKDHSKNVHRLKPKKRLPKTSSFCCDLNTSIFEYSIKLANYLCDKLVDKIQKDEIEISRRIFRFLKCNNKICSVPKRTSINTISRGLWQACDKAALFISKIMVYIENLTRSSYEPSTISLTVSVEELDFIEYVDHFEETEFDLSTLITIVEMYHENNVSKDRVFSKDNLPDLLFPALIGDLKQLKATRKENTPLNILAKVFQEKFNDYVIQTRPDLLSEKACRVICFASYELAKMFYPETVQREPSEESVVSTQTIRTICSTKEKKGSQGSIRTICSTRGARHRADGTASVSYDNGSENLEGMESTGDINRKELEEIEVIQELEQLVVELESEVVGEEEEIKVEEEIMYEKSFEEFEEAIEEKVFEEIEIIEEEELEQEELFSEEESITEEFVQSEEVELESLETIEEREMSYEYIEEETEMEMFPRKTDLRVPINIMPHEPDMVCCASVKAWATWLKEVADNTRKWSIWIQTKIAKARDLIQTLRGEMLDEKGNTIQLRREEWNDFVVQLDRDVVRWRHYNETVQELTEQIVSHFKNKRVECCSICLKEGWSVYDLDIEHLCDQLLEALETTQYWRRWLGNIIDQTESITEQIIEDNVSFLEMSTSAEMLQLVADQILKTGRQAPKTQHTGSLYSISRV